MPMYDYRCFQGHVHDAMVPYEFRNEARECPHCGEVASIVWLQVARVVGPVFSDVEKFEGALLTKKQRDAGMRITSKKDVDALEARHGLTRVDVNSRAHRARLDDQRDEARDIARVRQEGGRAAVADHLVKTTMQEAMGWGDTRYRQWKEMKDAAESRIQSGAAERHVQPVEPVNG